MRTLWNIIRSFFRRLAGRPVDGVSKSRLVGMYLSEANDLGRSAFDNRRNRETQRGKSFTNRERD